MLSCAAPRLEQRTKETKRTKKDMKPQQTTPPKFVAVVRGVVVVMAGWLVGWLAKKLHIFSVQNSMIPFPISSGLPASLSLTVLFKCGWMLDDEDGWPLVVCGG